MHKLLESLTSAYAVSGDEKRLHDLLREALAGLVTEIHETPLGNLLAVRRGQSSDHSILFAAHLDEVGGWVTRINDKGFLGIHCRSVDPRVWPGQQVVVHGTRSLAGIIGLKPVHVMSREELERPLPMEELWVDVGLPRDEVEACVPIGSTITYAAGMRTLLGDRFAGKTMDDRLGAVALVQALELLNGRALPFDVVMAFTVQEEVTGNGAWTTGYTARPDAGIAVDVTHGDTDGVPEYKTIPLGGGPGLTVGPVINDHVLDLLRRSAKAIEVPFHEEPSMAYSGTDADELQLSAQGIATGVLSIPLRYMHSPVETADQTDVDRAARLIAEVAVHFDTAFLGELYGTATA